MSDIDLSTFPNIEIPSNLSSHGSQEPQELSVQLIPFPFCLAFNGRAWQTIIVSAPSVQAAVVTMDQLVQTVNTTLERLGYPPNICSSASGACN
jgi:hypothetical protein